jgi:hypothetical protein
MAPTSLVDLAASLRQALDEPLIAGSKAEQQARLEIIDMIPLLNRKLVGEVQTLRAMAWEVSSQSRPIPRTLYSICKLIWLVAECFKSQSRLALGNRKTRASG